MKQASGITYWLQSRSRLDQSACPLNGLIYDLTVSIPSRVYVCILIALEPLLEATLIQFINREPGKCNGGIIFLKFIYKFVGVNHVFRQ